MSTFAYIRPQNQLYKEAKIAKVKQRALEALTNFPDVIRKDKHNMELLLMVCNIVENSITNTGKKDRMKIDKKVLVIEILNSLFGSLKPEDIDTISKNIEYLVDNNQIQKFSTWVILTSTCVSWLKRKLN
jgi:hypothetical protein